MHWDDEDSSSAESHMPLATLHNLPTIPTLIYKCSSIVEGLAFPLKKECLPTALASMLRSSGRYHGSAVPAQVGEEPHPPEGQLRRACREPVCHRHVVEEPLQKLRWRGRAQAPAPVSTAHRW